MVWGCIWKGGMGPLIFCNESVNSEFYCEKTLANFLPWYKEKLNDGPSLLLQEDNAPAHSSKFTKAWKSQSCINLLDNWPASSPDLNLIEWVWDMLEKRIRKRKPLPNGKTQLKQALLEEWRKISVNDIDCLYDSMEKSQRGI